VLTPAEAWAAEQWDYPPSEAPPYGAPYYQADYSEAWMWNAPADFVQPPPQPAYPPPHAAQSRGPFTNVPARPSPPAGPWRVPHLTQSPLRVPTTPVPNHAPSAAQPPAPTTLVVVDARDLFLEPGRRTRPGKLVVVLRGLPGSGKSSMAKRLKDLEARHRPGAPGLRVMSIDDYYTQETTETVTNPATGRPETVVRVAYEWEDDMEDAYRASLSKAMARHLQGTGHPVAIVDDWCPTAASLDLYAKHAHEAQAEMYVVECGGRDPVANFDIYVGRTTHPIPRTAMEAMRDRWEVLPPRFKLLSHLEEAFEADQAPEPQRSTAKDDRVLRIDEDVSAATLPDISPAGAGADKPAQQVSSSESDDDQVLEQPSSSRRRRPDPRPDPPAPKRLRPTRSAASSSNALAGLLSAYCKKRVRWADLEGLDTDDRAHREEGEEDEDRHGESSFTQRAKSEEQRFAAAQREALLRRAADLG